MLKRTEYNGWAAGQLENRWLRIHVLPMLGGRIIQLEMNGYEYFYVDHSLSEIKLDSSRLGKNGAWLNAGGEKIWPAPQGWSSDDQWPGPPDPVIDSGEYTLDESGISGIVLTSPFDPYTGLQISREISLSETTTEAAINVTFSNKSKKAVKWSVWPVCQLNAAGNINADRYQIICPVNPESIFCDGFTVMHGLSNSPQYRITDHSNLVVSYKYLVGKVGLDTDSGWAAYLDKETGKTFILRFSYCAGKKYPENTSFQVWTSGRGLTWSRGIIKEHSNDPSLNPPYMEMELLSPLEEIEPGNSFNFKYTMAASTIPENSGILSVNSCCVIADHLKAEALNDKISVTGKYGVFTEGKIKLFINDLCRYEMDVMPLKGVSLSVCIDKENLLCNEACGIKLVLYDKADRFLGLIENI